MVKLAHRSRKSDHPSRERGRLLRETSSLVQEKGGHSHETSNPAPGPASLLREMACHARVTGGCARVTRGSCVTPLCFTTVHGGFSIAA